MSADVLLFPLGRQPWQADAHVQPEVLLVHVLKLAAFNVWILLPLRAAKSRLASFASGDGDQGALGGILVLHHTGQGAHSFHAYRHGYLRLGIMFMITCTTWQRIDDRW
jgi:hypothetical protein